jgi:dienelactone hydrolase
MAGGLRTGAGRPRAGAFLLAAGTFLAAGAFAAASPPDPDPAAPSEPAPAPGPPRRPGPGEGAAMLRMFLKTRAEPNLPVHVYAGGGAVGEAAPAAAPGPDVDEAAPAGGAPAPGPPAVILFSSGFGWTPVLQQTAGRMAERGHPVLGIETPEYFKKEVGDDALRADLATMRAFINDKAGRSAGAPVVLSGFSYGAEMVPYFINRAGAEGVRGVLLIAPDARGAKLFRASVMLKMDSPPGEAFEVAREMARMPPLPAILIQGENDTEAAGPIFLPVLRGPRKLVVVPGGDHQFRDVRGAYLLQIDHALQWIDGMAAAASTPPPPEAGLPPGIGRPPDTGRPLAPAVQEPPRPPERL